ncbi:4Fe-4S binding protein [Herbivorax sp. ANBcel31]|uniref:4Fe-4S binding protein n=1 Tax=Herbivorax sp. ANBcel31 TaxID=3069754 RepID=UPI0027B76C9B|nr:4Fe-4S binding protein [Herbivorax sp. ANBcel31]MDQ2085447.1 4Fe-4S binding protein [Herbivorax sp. ANBcel31]
MTQADYKELKKGGFMKQVQKDRFSLRLRVAGGNLDAKGLKKVYEIALKYGEGYIHMTARQSLEIPFIKLEDVDKVKKELSLAGLQPGACGPRVRTVTACQGCNICPSGLIDAAGMAKELDSMYYARELPHKFKFGITGCKNNCLKAQENDLGIKGGLKPSWVSEKCIYCGLCEAVCPTKAIKVNKEEKRLEFNENDCVYCGKCVKGCPTDAWEGEVGFILYFGGLFGNTVQIGKQILPIIFSTEDLHKVAEVTLEFYKKYGNRSERFGHTLNRVGWEVLEKELKEVLK